MTTGGISQLTNKLQLEFTKNFKPKLEIKKRKERRFG